MKYKRLAYFLLAGILAMACVKQPSEVPMEQQGEYVTIQASLDTDATKTYLDGVQVKWEAGDEIALWFGKLGTAMDDEAYKLLSGENTTSAVFRGYAPAKSHYMGVYPYSASNGCDMDGKLTVTLPTMQTATAGSFGPGANVAVAYVAVAYPESINLSFKNLGGLMAVTLSGTGGKTVKTMRLTGTSTLSGKVEVAQASIEDGNPVAVVTDGVDYVELTGTFAGGNTYYFVALPGSHTGFTLQLYDDAGRIATATSEHAFEIARNSNTLIANLSVPDNKWKTEEKVFLNEIQPNESPFIELYNGSRSEEVLKDWTLWVNGSKVWTGTDQVLSVGGLLVLNGIACPADKNVKVELKNPEGVVRDSYIRGEEGSGWGSIDLPGNVSASFSRVPNGTGPWKYASPTSGTANGAKTGTIVQYPAANGVVVLNEINGNDKFIELYSTATDYKISLEDMTIQYKGKLAWTGQAGYSIEPGGYVLLYSADVTKPGKAQEGYDVNLTFSTGLSAKSSIQVQLFDVAGASLDNFQRVLDADSQVDDSFARTPDGTGSWHIAVKTPGSANGASTGDIPGIVQ